jgi:hypothetical protein
METSLLISFVELLGIFIESYFFNENNNSLLLAIVFYILNEVLKVNIFRIISLEIIAEKHRHIFLTALWKNVN